MKKLLLIAFCILTLGANAQIKKYFKFSTFYAAVNGGTSVSDLKTFKVSSGQLEEGLTTTPYDYSITMGIRKIARFG